MKTFKFHVFKLLHKFSTGIFKCIAFLFLLGFSLLSYAQDESSYLQKINILEQKINDSELINTKIEFYIELIELSSINDLENVLKFSNELLVIAESSNNTKALAYATFYKGDYYLENNNYDECLALFKLSLQKFEELENENQLGAIYKRLGLAYQYLNEYDNSLLYYQKAIEVFELIDSKQEAAVSYQDIGTLYNDIEKYSLALFYYEKAIEIYQEFDNQERVAAIYQNIGVLQYNWGNLEESISFYEKSLTIYEKLKDKRCIAISLSNIGLVYEENKRYSEARDYYEKSLLMFEEIKNDQALVYIFYNLGSIYRNIKDYRKSIAYFNKGLNLSQKLSMKDYISYNYQALSGVYEILGKNRKALDYYKDYIIVKDSIFDEEHFNQIAEYQAKFQNAQKQKEIEFLKLNDSIKDSELKEKEAQNMILIFSSFLIFVIAVILFLFTRSQRRLTHKLSLEVNERKKSEAELKILTNDLEIRVKERTVDLEQANNKLITEIEQHRQTTKDLETAKNKAEESDKIKSSFLANISHEVRTPLNAILGFSQMFEHENLPVSKRRSYISKIKTGCKSLTNLIDDIIEFASIEAGEAKVENKEFNPHPTLEFLHDHYANEILKLNKDSLVLRFDNENSDRDLLINTDPIRLKQILSILLDNAVKFTNSGSIDFGFVHSNNKEIDFYVKDTGIGIDKKYNQVIFERFTQLEEYSTRNYGGTGIGLSVAKRLVQMLNGKIWFESTLGIGTTFYVKLPCNGKTIDETPLVELVEYKWKDKVILIAEDKEINYEIIKETLSITDVDLIWAKNGQEALNVIKSDEKVDLILMDIQMPVMNGYETTKAIKAITTEIPIIAHTAYALQQDNIKCFEAGCDDYISKPISLNLFMSKINKYLS
jgi:signal transduction histidine kinase/CheY-like chemotaxis protein